MMLPDIIEKYREYMSDSDEEAEPEEEEISFEPGPRSQSCPSSQLKEDCEDFEFQEGRARSSYSSALAEGTPQRKSYTSNPKRQRQSVILSGEMWNFRDSHRAVDQSVNLMDMDASMFEQDISPHQSSSNFGAVPMEGRPRRSSKRTSIFNMSLVDVMLGETTDMYEPSGGARRRRSSLLEQPSKQSCRKVSMVLILVVLVLAVCVTLISVLSQQNPFGGIFVSNDNGNEHPKTPKPTSSPTKAPTSKPTKAPTQAPTNKPTKAPTAAPVKEEEPEVPTEEESDQDASEEVEVGWNQGPFEWQVEEVAAKEEVVGHQETTALLVRPAGNKGTENHQHHLWDDEEDNGRE